VFAIETKARTKKAGRHRGRDYEALFDGETIQFPALSDRDTARQARRNAAWLADLLTRAIGEKVAVRAIVALPGWWVTLKADSDLKVLSATQVPSFIRKERATLSSKAIQQISHQVEQRCRDVEF
jgi:hypothetical protein